ncbi:hypothetical protein JFU47_32085 [Pseudomonas sp. TH39(2020)]|uniref:hypothetical protein n=1 Tax=Pseudomonas sp. TH39(2020) TaxID=2796349 RepID=UPI001914830D|nr:hypothetical protein [Pseudomonas sp. TH39(2020)]MBK5401317.1 hypothetical protein [Pseudomonas sp. TH39(2020)]
MTARGRPPGQLKTGGRIKGRSLDKGERQLVTSQMAGDLMAVYKKLGGVRWLLKFAEDNPAEFLRQGLSRLFPSPAKDDEGGTFNQQINFNNLDLFEASRRVAFALNLGIQAQQELAAPVAERVPEEYINPNQWTPPVDAPDMLPPEPAHETPVDDPDRTRWLQELDMTPDQRRDAALVRSSKTGSIESYAGSSAEQGGHGPVQRQVSAKPTAAELCRRMSRRNELL